MQKKIKRKTEKYSQKAILDWNLISCVPATAPEKGAC
jgi:hypothetical protein